MGALQLVSIILEAAIVVLCLLAAFSREKQFMLGFALTFAIYVFYDAANLFTVSVPGLLLEGAFFIATLSALWSAWQVYGGKK
ncbi:MAG TPA: hypothetical protein PLO51_00425 [Candidatus Micrarchaeota archaeon]|nr:hypothetical protein [Candidatus Micrarchaeota archaeon]